MKILDENYYDLIINNAIAPIYANDDNITYINERHALIHLPAADNICSLGTMPYHIFPDRKSTRLNSSHITRSRMPSSA